ncbi:DUF5063 domain-containing protein, partial [Streptomyces lunaelactis]|uniref:DUF5063 domain-containing protein n=1 Tax=Streptomyces lunaelactis TaxID=1535768 RepID=UPI0020C7CD30
DLRHGLAHYRSGRTSEALWWWQFSYFSNWGPRLKLRADLGRWLGSRPDLPPTGLFPRSLTSACPR